MILEQIFLDVTTPFMVESVGCVIQSYYGTSDPEIII
jgi:hypothetical protein